MPASLRIVSPVSHTVRLLLEAAPFWTTVSVDAMLTTRTASRARAPGAGAQQKVESMRNQRPSRSSPLEAGQCSRTGLIESSPRSTMRVIRGSCSRASSRSSCIMMSSFVGLLGSSSGGTSSLTMATCAAVH